VQARALAADRNIVALGNAAGVADLEAVAGRAAERVALRIQVDSLPGLEKTKISWAS
jgi:hypothetical protein